MRRTSFFLICLISIWAVRRRRALTAWAAIELNLLILLPSLTFSSRAFRGPSGLKFFFVQSLGGLLLLLALSQRLRVQAFFYSFIIRILILLKIGGFPFHSWLLTLGPELKWENLVVVLTIQKIIPLHFLSHVRSSNLILIRAFAWLTIRARGLIVIKTKKLIILSSIFFLAALVLAPILVGANWKKLLLVYFLIFLSVSFLRGGEKEVLTTTCGGGRSGLALIWLRAILILSGAPPFLGFYLKLEVIAFLWRIQERLGLLVFLLGRAIFLFIYVTLILFLIINFQHLKTIIKKSVSWRVISRGLRVGGLFLF